MIERLKDVYHWHIKGRCRKHDRALASVKFDAGRGEFCDTMFFCQECNKEKMSVVS